MNQNFSFREDHLFVSRVPTGNTWRQSSGRSGRSRRFRSFHRQGARISFAQLWGLCMTGDRLLKSTTVAGYAPIHRRLADRGGCRKKAQAKLPMIVDPAFAHRGIGALPHEFREVSRVYMKNRSALNCRHKRRHLRFRCNGCWRICRWTVHGAATFHRNVIRGRTVVVWRLEP